MDLCRFIIFTNGYQKSHPDILIAIEEIALEFFIPLDAGRLRNIVSYVGRQNPGVWIGQMKEFIYNCYMGDIGQDKQVSSVYVPLEKNRVFDMCRLAELGRRGKELMAAGTDSCTVWDAEVANLKEILESLPEEARSPELRGRLSGAHLPYNDPIYGTMGECIYNTTMKLVEDIPKLDADAAEFLDGITGVLGSGITMIKSLEEELKEVHL